MIIFNTENYELYNEIIHNFLYVEVFENPKIDKGDILEEILPKYLFREQYKKSLKVLDELYEWTDDKFFHEMGCFHEMMLYYFLEHISYIKKELKDAFIKCYFKNETIKKMKIKIVTWIFSWRIFMMLITILTFYLLIQILHL